LGVGRECIKEERLVLAHEDKESGGPHENGKTEKIERRHLYGEKCINLTEKRETENKKKVFQSGWEEVEAKFRKDYVIRDYDAKKRGLLI